MDQIFIGSFVILHFWHRLPSLTYVNDIVFGSEYVPNLSFIKVPITNTEEGKMRYIS